MPTKYSLPCSLKLRATSGAREESGVWARRRKVKGEGQHPRPTLHSPKTTSSGVSRKTRRSREGRTVGRAVVSERLEGLDGVVLAVLAELAHEQGDVCKVVLDRSLGGGLWACCCYLWGGHADWDGYGVEMWILSATRLFGSLTFEKRFRCFSLRPSLSILPSLPFSTPSLYLSVSPYPHSLPLAPRDGPTHAA